MRRVIFGLFAIIFATASVAAELGEDGLHKAPWMQETFKDLREDLADANAQGKRLMLLVEQRGCIYCTKMHEEVYVIPEIEAMLEEDFYVVQINMFGDLEVTDFDGVTMAEKDIVRKWGALFTPNAYFLPQEVPEGQTAVQSAVAVMPGAFGKWTTMNMLRWVLEEGYNTDEPFQKYHARKFLAQKG